MAEPLRKNSPVIRPKGQRYPGSGRVKGTPNRVTVEARQLVSELVNDPRYQWKLRKDFAARKLHPTIEGLVWAYHLGRPRLDVNVTGAVDVTVNARIEEERRIYASLDLRDLEQLAAESQALVDRAQALAKARTAENGTENPQDIGADADRYIDAPRVDPNIKDFSGASDNGSYGSLDPASTEAPSTEAPGVDSGGNLSRSHGTTTPIDHEGEQ